MFSKAFRWSVLILFVVQVSCTPKFGEEPPPQRTLEVQSDPCLIKATEEIGKFVIGEADSEKLSSAWGCFNNVIVEFRKYVRGREEGKYSSQELATFIQNNFLEKEMLPLSKKVISSELQTEFMRLKQILVGGSIENLTMDELGEILNVLTAFRTMSVELNPHMKILSLTWKPNLSEATAELERFEQANLAIQKFAKDFSGLVLKNQPAYSFTHFISLIRSFESFSGQTWTWIDSFEKFVPLLKKVKKALAGGDENQIVPDEWRRFILLGSRIYIQFLRYNYFIGKSDPNSSVGLQFVARTFEDTLSLFQDMVSEKPSGVVSITELGEIFNAVSLAWPEFKYSDRMIVELMKVKKTLIGGDSEHWTAKDFERAKLQVTKIKSFVEKMWPYFSVYALDWKPESLPAQDREAVFRQAREALLSVSKEFGALLVNPYSYNDLLNLVQEVQNVYSTENRKINAYSDLVNIGCAAQQLKAILFDERKVGEQCVYSQGRPQSWEVKKNQWGSFLETISQAYTSYLQLHYFVDGTKLKTGQDYSRVSWVASDIKNVLAEWIQNQKTKIFTVEELSSLAMSLKSGGLISENIRSSSLSQVIGTFFNVILNPPEDRLRGIKPGGLTIKNLEYFHNEVQIWAELNTFFQSAYEIKGVPLSNVEVQNLVRAGLSAPQNSINLKQGLVEIQMVVNGRLPLVLNPQKRVLLAPLNTYFVDDASFRQWNTNRLIARAIQRSFSRSLQRIGSYRGIYECEALSGFESIKGIFEDIGLVSPQSPGFISSRFLEANIFVPHSNGDFVAGFDELSELISLIFSGFNINSELESYVKKECLPGRENVTQKDKVSYDCLRKSVRKYVPTVFGTMPEYLKYFRKTAAQEWSNSFFENLKAAGYRPTAEGLVSLSDAGLYSHIIQYTEILFLKFDANRDGIMSKSDAINAYPTFQTLITSLAEDAIKKGLIKSDDLEAVFTYILKFGKIPGCDKKPIILCLADKEVRQWLDWSANYMREDYTIFADRDQIARILGLIVDETNKANAGKPPIDPNKCVVPAR